MNDSISMFIDDELDLDEKMDFINEIHADNGFLKESIALLEQEKFLRSDVVSFVPGVSLEKKQRFYDLPHLTPFFRVARVGVVAAVLVLFAFSFQWKTDDAEASISKRFVIYKPEVSSVKISGSFTEWKNIPMEMIGPSGYWEIELDVTKGEHKYIFIVGDDKKIADPTIMMRERDDFGSENTILLVEA